MDLNYKAFSHNWFIRCIWCFHQYSSKYL